MKKILMLLFCCLAMNAIGQIGFTKETIKIQEEIAYKSNIKNLKTFMKKAGYTQVDKSTTGKTIKFDGGDYPTVIVYYHADNRLIEIYAAYSPQTYYQGVIELKECGFSVITSTKKVNGNGVEVQEEVLGKAGYPYRFLADPIEMSIQLLTSIAIMY